MSVPREPSSAGLSDVDICRHCSGVDLSNSVPHEWLNSSFLVGDVLKNCRGVWPKGGAVDWKVQFVHNYQVETCRDCSDLEF